MSQQEVKRGVQVIQIVKVGNTINILSKGDLGAADVNLGLDIAKQELIKLARGQLQPRLDLKVRQMP